MRLNYPLIGLSILFILIMSGCVQQKNVAFEEKENEQPQAEIQEPEYGLGSLCYNEDACIPYCSENRGQCEEYCKGNENELCLKIFPTEDQSQERQENAQEEKPVLKNLGVDIGPWDKSTNLAGDLVFTKDLLFEDDYIMNEWVFIEFGARGQRKNDPNENIEFWFFVPRGTDVRAPVDGIAHIAYFEHTKDWGINFQSKGNSEWIVSFEHVVDVNIKNGDVVKAGDIIAKAAPRVNDELAMIEVAVWTGGQGIYKYCSFDFLDESLKPAYHEKLTRLAQDWEEFVGKDIYQEEKWVSPGCLVEKIKEA